MNNFEEQKQILINNLIKFRKINKLTQLEVGEKINYTDKAVSKWERGEALPDISVLFELSKIYNISLCDFFNNNEFENQKTEQNPKRVMTNYVKNTINIMSVLGIWVIACTLYMILSSIPTPWDKAWLCFIYAIPLSFIVMLVFNCIWGKITVRPWIISLLVWSLALSFFFSYPFNRNWLIFIPIGVLQLIAFIWYSVIIQNKKYLKFESKNNIDN